MLRGDSSFLVECYVPGVHHVDVEMAAARVATVAASLRNDGTSIAYGGAILVPGDEVVLHLFRSEGRDAVLEACERAGLPYERILDTVAVTAGENAGY